MKQAFNPYMKSWEYVPDAEPHVVGDRVYVYGSHDHFNGISFCMGDYVCWSAPLSDPGDWRYEGVIFTRDQEPAARGGRVLNGMAAPDMVQGRDGRFYLYYFVGGTKMISVAVCDTPAGKYRFHGHVRYADGIPIGKKKEPLQFDPGIFMDDDGRLYLYTGFGLSDNPIMLQGAKPSPHGPMVFELDPADMLTVVKGPSYIGVAGEKEAPGTAYEGHAFLEASSMRRFDGMYYYIYSSMQSHELCYAVSRYPDREFSYGGTLVSCGDIGLPGVPDVRHARNDTGNTHGSLIRLDGRYYVFYHRHSNRKQSSRQACAEEIRFENGKFYQAEMTSCGLNHGPLRGRGNYPSYIACNVYGRKGTRFLSMIKLPEYGRPYLTQDGPDRDSGQDQYVANVCDGTVVVFKYFDTAAARPDTLEINVCGKADGTLFVRDAQQGEILAEFPVHLAGKKKSSISSPFTGRADRQALYFEYEGKGSFSFYSFSLE